MSNWKATKIEQQDQTRTPRTLPGKSNAKSGADYKASKPASQEDSKVSGSNHAQGKPDVVRRANSVHRDSRSRLGTGKSSTIVTD